MVSKNDALCITDLVRSSPSRHTTRELSGQVGPTPRTTSRSTSSPTTDRTPLERPKRDAGRKNRQPGRFARKGGPGVLGSTPGGAVLSICALSISDRELTELTIGMLIQGLGWEPSEGVFPNRAVGSSHSVEGTANTQSFGVQVTHGGFELRVAHGDLDCPRVLASI